MKQSSKTHTERPKATDVMAAVSPEQWMKLEELLVAEPEARRSEAFIARNEAYIADLYQRLCEELKKSSVDPLNLYRVYREDLRDSGLDPGPSLHLLQVISRMVMMDPEWFLQDGNKPAMQLSMYFLAKDFLNRHPPKISEEGSTGLLVDWLKTATPGMTQGKAFKLAARVFRKEESAVRSAYRRFKGVL